MQRDENTPIKNQNDESQDAEKANQLAYSIGLLAPTVGLMVWMFSAYSSRVVIQSDFVTGAVDWLFKVGMTIGIILIVIMTISLFARGFWLAVRPYRGHWQYRRDLEQRYNRVADNLFSLYLFVFSYLLNALAISFPLYVVLLVFQQYLGRFDTTWVSNILLLGVYIIIFLFAQSLGRKFMTWIGLGDFLGFYETISGIRDSTWYYGIMFLIILWSLPFFLYRLEISIEKDIFVQGIDKLVIFRVGFGGEVRNVPNINISVTAPADSTNLANQFSVISEPSEGRFTYYIDAEQLAVGEYYIRLSYPRYFLGISLPFSTQSHFTILPEVTQPRVIATASPEFMPTETPLPASMNTLAVTPAVNISP